MICDELEDTSGVGFQDNRAARNISETVLSLREDWGFYIRVLYIRW